MIKRDLIQRIRVIPTDDTQGGNTITIEPYEFVKACVSITATGEQITQYGITTQKLLNVITDIKLDEYVYTRYVFEGSKFRLMSQVKRGREWFSVMMEVIEEEPEPEEVEENVEV